MDLKLKVLEGKNAGQEVPVTGKKFFIGRAEDCHLRPGSDLISRLMRVDDRRRLRGHSRFWQQEWHVRQW